MAKQRKYTFCVRVSPELGRILKELSIDKNVPMSDLAEKYLSGALRKDVQGLRERQAKEVVK